MTKQTTTMAVLAAVMLGMALVGLPLLGSKGPAPDTSSSSGWVPEPILDEPPTRILISGDQNRLGERTSTSSRRRPSAPRGESRGVPFSAGAEQPLRIEADRLSKIVLGNALQAHLNAEIHLGRHRDVIEHILTGNGKIGFITIEPSTKERRLGARDFVLGQVEPVAVVAANNPWQVLRLPQLQAVLGGRKRTWPQSPHKLELVGPPTGELSNVFAEILVPGDALAVRRTFEQGRDVLRHVASDTAALGIVYRGELEQFSRRNPDQVRRLHIDSLPLTREIRVVFTNEHEPTCAAVLQFCRSAAGREALGRTLTLR